MSLSTENKDQLTKSVFRLLYVISPCLCVKICIFFVHLGADSNEFGLRNTTYNHTTHVEDLI